MRIALTLSALKGMYSLACNIQSDYLNAKCRENIYIIAGEAFGSEAGSVMIVKMDLYRLNSLGS